VSKETWIQFYKRVKPTDGQQFIDDRGEWWEYYSGNFKHETSATFMSTDGFGKILSCSLLDAIEHVDHVEKPKLKKVTYYCYIFLSGWHWSTNADLKEPRAFNENGERMTKEVWVEDNA